MVPRLALLLAVLTVAAAVGHDVAGLPGAVVATSIAVLVLRSAVQRRVRGLASVVAALRLALALTLIADGAYAYWVFRDGPSSALLAVLFPTLVAALAYAGLRRCPTRRRARGLTSAALLLFPLAALPTVYGLFLYVFAWLTLVLAVARAWSFGHADE